MNMGRPEATSSRGACDCRLLQPGEEIVAARREGVPVEIAPGRNGLLRVLVVDDWPDVADSFVLLIELYGHHAEAAYDGCSALRLARDCPPDVALLDMELPDMTGLELAEQLRRQAVVDPPLLVAVSGHSDQRRQRQWADLALGPYLIKPVDPERLQRLLQEHKLQAGSRLGGR